MKTTSFLQRRTPLKSYTHLTAKVSLKRNPRRPNPNLARSGFAKKGAPTSQQGILDTIFSQCIRRAAADWRGYACCATCGSISHWRSMDCGHFQDRAHMATRYDPRNCAPQCRDCNRLGVKFHEDGNVTDMRQEINENFANFIDRVHGEGVADELRALAKTICPDFPFKEKILEWESILASLIRKSGNEIAY